MTHSPNDQPLRQGGEFRLWRAIPRAALAGVALSATSVAAVSAFDAVPATAATPTYAITATIPVNALATAVDPNTDTVYTIIGNTVDAINGATNAVTATIPVSGGSESLADDPVTDTLYVASSTSGIQVISGASNTVTAVIPQPGCGTHCLAVDPVTDTVYMSGSSSPDVFVISGATNMVTATIALPASASPEGSIAVNPSTNTVYVGQADITTSSVVIINGASNAITDTLSLANPTGVGVNAMTNTFYVESVIDGSTPSENVATMSVFNGSTNALISTIPTNDTADGLNFAVDPANNTLFVVDEAPPFNEVDLQVIDGSTNTVTQTLGLASLAEDVAVNSATGTVYANESGENGPAGLFVINPETTPLTVAVSGGQTYGSTNPTFSTSTAAPAGDSFTGTLRCTTIGSPPTTISPTLVPASYPINPSSCSGLSLSGPTASNYSIAYGGGSFVVTKSNTVMEVTPEGLLFNSVRATLTSATTGQPIAGQSVTFASTGHFLCTANTNASGVASCSFVLGISLFFTYSASYAGDADYGASSGTAAL
jgi:DNA-binding beta-propeller fold protein YncE